MRTLDSNPWLDGVRAAYRKSDLYRRIHERERVKETVGAALPREPGEDDDLPLGIARDALEQEFMDRANP